MQLEAENDAIKNTVEKPLFENINQTDELTKAAGFVFEKIQITNQREYYRSHLDVLKQTHEKMMKELVSKEAELRALVLKN